MTQPTFSEVREALAASIRTITGLTVTTDDSEQVNPPAAVVWPVTGSFIRYGETTDGAAGITLRVILLVARGDSGGGQELMDPYLAPRGGSSINAAVQADNTLGQVVDYASLAEATGYGLITWNAVEYLGCQMIVEIGI